MLKELYPTESVFLNYVQPFLVLRLFKVENKMSFYEMEKLVDTDAKFEFFNRPNQQCDVKHEKLGEARLPTAFTHWTYVVTGGEFMVVDLQGWRKGKG